MKKTTLKPADRQAKTYVFRVVIEEDSFADGRQAYHAYCPSLKGARTWGWTWDEALKNIKEVVEMTIESMVEHRENIPEESETQMLSDLKVAVVV